MKFSRIALAVCAALSLVACGVGPPSSAGSTPTTEVDAGAYKPPLADTNVDEVAIKAAFQTFDVLLSSIDFAREQGVKWFQPGTPSALRIQDALVLTKAALNSAYGFQKAGNEKNALVAFNQALSALADLKRALKPGG